MPLVRTGAYRATDSGSDAFSLPQASPRHVAATLPAERALIDMVVRLYQTR
jgi:hypothetical protein